MTTRDTREARLAEIAAGQTVHKQFTLQVEPQEARRVRFTITTTDPDRERDVVHDVVTDAYEENPVVLWAHDHRMLPIARCVALERKTGRIIATAEFAPAELNPMAEQVFRMVKAGFLKAASIGFLPLEWVYNESRRGVDFRKVELLEFSICSVPANSQALLAASASARRRSLEEEAMRDDDFVLTLADDDEPTFTVDPDALSATVRAALADEVSDVTARGTYLALCELSGRIPDADWQPPRRSSHGTTRAARHDDAMPDGLTAQQRAAWNLRMERMRCREESEERSRQLAEARRIAERTARAALPSLGVGPFGGNTPEMVDVSGTGWYLPRMPGDWRR